MNGQEWTEKLKTLKSELTKESSKEEQLKQEVKPKDPPEPPQGSIIKENRYK